MHHHREVFFTESAEPVCLREVPFFQKELHLLICFFQLPCQFCHFCPELLFILHTLEQKLYDIFFVKLCKLLFGQFHFHCMSLLLFCLEKVYQKRCIFAKEALRSIRHYDGG